MKICPKCSRRHDAASRLCTADGTLLVEAAPGEPSLGQVVGGRYRITGKLGKGGHGHVYLARHLEMPRDVAIKVLIQGQQASDELIARFRYEVETIVTIDHPHIVTIHDFGVDEEAGLYVVMERLRGKSLAERLRRGPLDTLDLLEMLIGVARALEAAHQLGVVHRDVKPANIFLEDDDEALCGFVAKLLDFGIAKDFVGAAIPVGAALSADVADPATPAAPADLADPAAPTGAMEAAVTGGGRTMGSPMTMSPEQAMAGVIDARSDLYSLGVVFFMALTGEPLFRRDDIYELLVAHVEDPPPVPSSRPAAAWAPASVDRLILELLAKDPGGRPDSAKEVVRRLQALRAPMSDAWAARRFGGPEATPPDSADTAAADDRPRPRVVVGDDEDAIVQLICLILDHAGYEALPALGGEKALQRLREERDVAALVIDLIMPDIDGIASIDAARLFGFEGPVFLCTSVRSEAVRQQVGARANVHFVDKIRELNRLPELLDAAGLRPVPDPGAEMPGQ